MQYKGLKFKNMDFNGPISASDELGKICGYASVFDQVDQHRDIIIKGAFKNIDLSKIKFLWQHDSNYPIGKITKLEEDYWGLYLEAELALDVEKAREAHALIKQGAISGLSIGFNSKEFCYDKNNNRIIEEIDLWEVSLVTFPANQNAVITDYKGFNHLLALRMLSETLDNAMKLLGTNNAKSNF